MPTIDPKARNEFWAQQERRVHGEYVREGMRRHPADLEKAYQWAYNQIQEMKNVPPAESLYHIPKPYEGQI